MNEMNHFSLDDTIEIYRMRLEWNLNDGEFYLLFKGVVNG